MNIILFLCGVGLVLLAFLTWGFRNLAKERWQFLAVIPLHKDDCNCWKGLNITYYGFFVATSQLLAFALLLILLSALHITLFGAVLATLIVMAFCVPATRYIALLVEKKRHTFTVGGASFIGIILAPWVIWVTGSLLGQYSATVNMPVIPILAAMSVAYTLGEGLGRLACISYGCCYGKPLRDANRVIRFLFSRINFTFSGDNKKALYEGHHHGEKLVPIQAITCLLYTFAALAGSYLYLVGHFTAALLLTMAVTQVWRFFSETLRADFRGFGRISVYQKMGITGVAYTCLVTLVVPHAGVGVPVIADGLRFLWQPGVIVGLQLLWLLFFFLFGRSTVTTSSISFELIRERI